MSNRGGGNGARPEWRGKRVLVTGASGFLGANLCRALIEAGAEVHAAVRPTSDLFRLRGVTGALAVHPFDLCDGKGVDGAVRDARPEFVFHSAAHTTRHVRATVSEVVNDTVVATARLLDALTAAGCGRLVHVGSSLEYGHSDRPHAEDDPLRPSTLRGATKAAATLLVLQRAKEGAAPAVVVRAFSIYGPWEPDYRLVPSAIRAALSGETLPLTEPGLRRDYVYVDDVCEACMRAALADRVVGESINAGTGHQTSNEEVVALVGRVTGRQVKVAAGAFPARASDRGIWAADIGKAERLLGWRPSHSLQEGLEETLRWYLKTKVAGAA